MSLKPISVVVLMTLGTVNSLALPLEAHSGGGGLQKRAAPMPEHMPWAQCPHSFTRASGWTRGTPECCNKGWMNSWKISNSYESSSCGVVPGNLKKCAAKGAKKLCCIPGKNQNKLNCVMFNHIGPGPNNPAPNGSQQGSPNSGHPGAPAPYGGAPPQGQQGNGMAAHAGQDQGYANPPAQHNQGGQGGYDQNQYHNNQLGEGEEYGQSDSSGGHGQAHAQGNPDDSYPDYNDSGLSQ